MKKSVAMAAYNGENYILEQLESIRTQTRPVDEVRICDDGSGDCTVELVRNYIKTHGLEGCWSIAVNEENLGYASNFRKAVQQTSGELIFFCDQDDIWLPDRVERMERIMEEYPQIQVLGSEFSTFSDSSEACQIPTWERKQMKHDGSLERKPFLAENIFIGSQGCTMCFRRSLWEIGEPYWFEGWAHDEFVWKLALCLDGLYVYHGDTLKRRLHADNASLGKLHTMEKRLRYLKDLSKSHEATLAFARDRQLPAQSIDLLAKNCHAVQLRIELLTKKKWFLTMILFFKYRECYHKKRAILKELQMAMKG